MHIFKVCHKVINQKVKPKEICLTKARINYNTRQMPEDEIDAYLRDLVKQRIVREMKFGDKGFLNPIMFLRKSGKTSKDNIIKVVDFRLLNAYSHTWKIQFLGFVSTVRNISSALAVFNVLDISLGFLHIQNFEKL